MLKHIPQETAFIQNGALEANNTAPSIPARTEGLPQPSPPGPGPGVEQGLAKGKVRAGGG